MLYFHLEGLHKAASVLPTGQGGTDASGHSPGLLITGEAAAIALKRAVDSPLTFLNKGNDCFVFIFLLPLYIC